MDITVSDEVSQEYHELVKNILCNREFLKLSLYTHHQWTTRLMHSINVSYLSWFIARKLGCDEKAAARAGLLHDFCPYDFRAETPTGEHQAFYHPKAAADNSATHFDVTDRELDAILSHMFPLGPLPRNKEAWIISFAEIKPAPSRKAAISPLHWPGGTGSSSIRHNFHTKNRAVATSDEPCFCVEIYFMVILCRLLYIS